MKKWDVMIKRQKLALFCVSILLIQAEAAFSKNDTQQSCSFLLASLNVENLHPTYLTLPDRVAEFTELETLRHTGLRSLAGTPTRRPYNWTSEKLALKLKQTKRLVSLMPRKPDVLGIIEVRDSTVSGKLASTLGYSEAIASHSLNDRGMDVALFLNPGLNHKIVSTREVPLTGPEFAEHPTRNLLAVTVLVADRFLLHYVVVHWPSQGGPTEARIEAARQTRSLIEKLLSDFPGSEAIVMGDFNTLDGEADFRGRHPFLNVLTQGSGPSRLTDLFSVNEFQAEGSQPPGTYFYAPKDQWNRLDRFFVTEGLLQKKATGLRITAKSFSIHAPEEITVEYTRPSGEKIRVPKSYDFESADPKNVGFTDHSGIYVGVEANWNETPGEPIMFKMDEDVILLPSVVLFPKKSPGARRFITYSEYLAEKDSIGKSGAHENYEVRPESSFEHLTDGPSDKNFIFMDARNEDEKADPNKWHGPKWDELVKSLNNPETARRVVIEIPAYRKHRPESVYQLLLSLYDQKKITELPKLENIRAVTVAP